MGPNKLSLVSYYWMAKGTSFWGDRISWYKLLLVNLRVRTIDTHLLYRIWGFRYHGLFIMHYENQTVYKKKGQCTYRSSSMGVDGRVLTLLVGTMELILYSNLEIPGKKKLGKIVQFLNLWSFIFFYRLVSRIGLSTKASSFTTETSKAV